MTVRDPMLSFVDLVLGDDWTTAAEVHVSGLIEKVDVTAYNGDAVAQYFTVERGEWTPDAGIVFKKGLAQSFGGLSELFAPLGGANAIRFKRRTAGVGATIDVRVFLTGGQA